MTVSAQVPSSRIDATVRFISRDGEVLQRFDLSRPAALSELREALRERSAQSDPLTCVRIRSGASPEGASLDNRALSDQRADEARLFLLAQLPELERIPLVVTSVGEDYESLYGLLSGSTIPGAERAVEIIRTVPIWVTDASGRVVDSRKKRLMDLRGGQTWTDMREQLFPRLRSTRIEFLFGMQSGAGAEDSYDIAVYFPQGRSEVVPSFRDNAAALARLASLLDGRTYEIGDILRVVGKASPEGREQMNEALARRRAEAIRTYIARRWPAFASAVSVTVEGEAWADFRAALQAEQSADAARALEVIGADAPADRKEADLRALPSWQRYYRSLFPDFRAAVISPDFNAERLTREVVGVPELSWDAQALSVRLAEDRLDVPQLTRRPRTLRPVFGLSTNLAYDITYVPNYGLTSIPSVTLEYYPARTRHFTFGLDFECPMWQHWDEHRFLQVNNLTLWTRRYFRKRDDRFRGLYLLANVNLARFGIGWEAHGWEGEGIGGSLGLGCKWVLGRSRMFIDVGIAGGVFAAQYDPYVFGNDATKRYYYDYAGDPLQFRERNHRLLWFGPTRAYISLGVDLFNRKRR